MADAQDLGSCTERCVGSTPISCILSAAVVLCTAIFVRADQLMIPGAQPQNVTIVDFSADKIAYQTRAGDRNERELSRIERVHVDGETALNEAETLFSQDQREKSIDGYIKAIRSTVKPWVKQYAARRLVIALGNGGRFDARMIAYLVAIASNPDAAGGFKPELTSATAVQLESAVGDVENTLKQPNLSPAAQLGLYNFLIDLHRQRKDEPAVIQTLERLDRLSNSLGNNPEIKQQLAGAKVNQAKTAFDQKKYSDVIKIINDNRQNITEPRLQADAMFLLARARQANTLANDTAALKDIAVQYMRVVAHFSDMEGKPNVLPSMLAAAAILEKIGEKADSVTLLEQITKEFPDDPAAQQARQDLDRLKAVN